MININEDLRNWFSSSHPDGGWKRINSKGEAVGPCAREPGEPKPKCMSNRKRKQLSKKERAAAVRSKRKNDPNPERKGKPINVSNFGKGKIGEEYVIDPTDDLIESMDLLLEKNKPTSPDKWAGCISQAKAKFDVYPSAYANGWASKCYKGKGGKWKAVSEQKLSFSAFISEMSSINEENNCGCDQNLTESKKPYKGFVKGKNHPEGGLSRKEAHRQGIHAGIETKDEAKRKGGFGKLSGKTQARRKSFCARMCGMKRRNTSAKTANDPKSKINAALRVWGCRCGTNESYETETTMLNERRSVRELIEGKIKNFLISEMAQTAERKAEMKAKIATTSEKEKRAGDRAAKADDRKEIGPHTMDYGSNRYQKIAARHRAAQDDSVNVIVQDAKEKNDETKLYGKGGKVAAVRKWSPVKKAKKPVKEEFITMILEKKKMGDPCWVGYHADGMKMKNGKSVPNCVPVKESSMNEIQLRVKEKFMAEGAEGCGCGGKDKPKPKPKPTIKRPKNQITEEVVNKSNQPMTKKEIKKRDKIKKGLGDVAIVKKGDTKENAKYRLATYITLLKKKKKKG